MPNFFSWRKKRAKRAAANATAPGHGEPLAIRQPQAKPAARPATRPQAKPQDGYVKLWARAFESLSQGTRQEQEDGQKLQNLYGTGSQSSSCTGEDVLANLLLESQQRRNEADENSWRVQIGTRTWILRDVADKILTWLGKFKEVGDVAVSFDPVHAALPWAAFRFLLQAATIMNQHAAEILLGLEQAAKICLRCRVYEKLYLGPDSHASATARNANKQSLKTVLGSIAAPEQLKSKLSELTRLEKEVEIATDICHREASKEANDSNEAAHRSLLDLLDERFSRLDDAVTSIWTTTKDDERYHMLRWISEVPFQSDLENVSASRLDGTCEWLISHPQYEHWRNFSSSTTLWLHGIPGAGKTRLTSKVIEGTLNRALADEGVAYFFCDRSREDRREPVSVLCSLVRQLTCCREGNRIMPCARDMYLGKKSRGFASDHLTLKECRELLVKLAGIYTQTTIIIDGLDECDERTRHSLMESIDYIFTQTPRLVKVFIASRDDKDIKDRYGGGENLTIRACDNQEDINTYVKTKMELRRWCREKMTKQTKDNIEEVFSRKSNGMFQWAALHINDLLELESETLVSDYLDALPEGLAATYAQIYNSIDRRKRHVFDTAFQWLIGSYVELTPEELEVAVSQQPDTSFSPKTKFDIDFIVATCKNLIHVVTESGSSRRRTCQFVHLSVQEYFEEHHWCPKIAKDLVLRSHICYCTHALDGESSALPLWNQRMRRWDKQYAYLGGTCLPKTLESLLLFLGHPNESSPSFQAWGCSLVGHRVEVTEPTSIASNSRDYYNQLGWNRTQWRQGCWVYCIIMGLHDVIHAWLRSGCLSPNARDVRSNTALGIAVRAGREQLCELLLDEGADANLTGSLQLGSALSEAAYRNHLTIGNLLLTKGGADPNAIDCGYYKTALVTASKFGHHEFVKLLLEHGADPNIVTLSEGYYDRPGGRTDTALGSAAARAYIEIGRLLLKAGADVNLPEGRSPLLRTIANDQEGYWTGPQERLLMIKLLIAWGADVNAHCGASGTPLQIVLGFGRTDPAMVRTLRDAGAVYDKTKVPPGKLNKELRDILTIYDGDYAES
ncbi:hypothetical protein PG991_008689 [Apiospora marii]|uniref:Nephrocystin 3-like N-terminal domain-containing protein n=1 Tax=Apiospora marii TaxID=335849 RepID=A0ABR1RMI6_9PEZI